MILVRKPPGKLINFCVSTTTKSRAEISEHLQHVILCPGLTKKNSAYHGFMLVHWA